MNTTNKLNTFANEFRKILIGLDLASKEIQLSYVDSDGVERDYKLKPQKFLKFISENTGKPFVFAMEACGCSNYWASLIKRVGFEVYIFPAKSCRKNNYSNHKDDRGDARGVRNALLIYKNYPDSATFKPCIIRDEINRQQMYMIKRYSELQSRITATNRNLIAFLKEQDALKGLSYEMTPSQTIRHIKDFICDYEQCENKVEGLCETLSCQCAELEGYALNLALIENKFFEHYASTHQSCEKYLTVPGVGIPLAVAVSVSTQDNFDRFKNANSFVAFMQLIPVHHGTGGKNKVGKHSTEGNKTLKSLFYEGGNSLVVAHNKLVAGKKLDAMKLDLKDKRRKISYAKEIAKEIYKVATDGPTLKQQSAPDKENDPVSTDTSAATQAHSESLGKKIARNKISKFRSKLKALNNSICSALSDPVLYEILKETAEEQLGSLLNSLKNKVNEGTPWQNKIIAEIKNSPRGTDESSIYEAALD